MSLWSESLERRILNLPEIHSPPHAFFTAKRINEAADRVRRLMDVPPWYAVRGPLEPYEWPELRQAARLLRRAIRRNLHTLLTDPQSPVSLEIQTAMTNRPERPEMKNFHDEVRRLLDAGTIQVRPEVVKQWMKDCGARVEKGLDTSI